MLKIKGLKKKKKSKKGKHKEEELFDPKELEQYRREQQQKAEAGEQSNQGASSSEQSDEWQRFKALTAGVDNILKKSQGDLDRIKSTSYFQKKSISQETENKEPLEKPVLKTKNRWVGFEDNDANVEHEESDNQEIELKESTNLDKKAEPILTKEENAEDDEAEEEEEEEECEEDEDIFDTSYVDVVASGEVKLAYIPDSPLDDKDTFDPFDTSIVERVIKTVPNKRTLVSLGSAVDVLTGKVEKSTCLNVTKIRKPRKQDLLLESFDECETINEDSLPKVIEDTPVFKTLLDEDTDILDNVIDLSVNLAINLIAPTTAVESKFADNEEYISKSLDEDFVCIENNPSDVTKASPDLNEDLDDEFVALAVESLLKDTGKTLQVDDHSDDTENNKKSEQTPQTILKDFSQKQDKSKQQFDKIYEETSTSENDPFDTSFTKNIFPGKYELKLIEEEILVKEHAFPKSHVPSLIKNLPSVQVSGSEFNDTDELNEHNFLDDNQVPLSFKHRDLLGGSTTDLSKIGQCPIEPEIPQEDEQVLFSDPFDTSVADNLVIPGKTELKFLEKELLTDTSSCTGTVNNDDNFDPRAAESSLVLKPFTRPDQLSVGEKRASVPKVVAFSIGDITNQPDLLSVGCEESSKITKPLTPYYADPKDIENNPSFESECDPFDTSFVTSVPGKHELKLIESELVGDIVSDQQNNSKFSENTVLTKFEKSNNSSVKPPSYLPINKICSSSERLKPDILSEDTVLTIKLHTPVVPRKLEDDIENIGYTDPFDTSIVNSLLPGKAELKLIEYELIGSEEPTTSIKRSYTDPDFNPRDSDVKVTHIDNIVDQINEDIVTEKSLIPIPTQHTETLEEDIDPFDTSCVDKLVPGRVELKLLESELVSK